MSDRDETHRPPGRQVRVTKNLFAVALIDGQVWSRLPVSFKRAVGTYFDCICLLLLASIPLLVHGQPAAFDFQRLMQGQAVQFWSCCLREAAVFTPIPFICFRFVCRVVMRLPTPGEMLCGYVNICVRPGPFSWLRQLCFAGCQYVVVAISVLLGLLCAFLLYIALGSLQSWGVFGSVFRLFSLLCIFHVVLLVELTAFNESSDPGLLEGNLDALFGLKVVDQSWLWSKNDQKLEGRGTIERIEPAEESGGNESE